jgi:hypothetical protein
MAVERLDMKPFQQCRLWPFDEKVSAGKPFNFCRFAAFYKKERTAGGRLARRNPQVSAQYTLPRRK